MGKVKRQHSTWVAGIKWNGHGPGGTATRLKTNGTKEVKVCRHQHVDRLTARACGLRMARELNGN